VAAAQPDVHAPAGSAAERAAARGQGRHLDAQHSPSARRAPLESDLFDPFGLALEQYDGIGKFRTTYPDGSTIDPATSLVDSEAYPGGLAFSGLAGAADAVSQNPKFATCISEKLLTYSLGRLLTETDHPYLDVVNEEWLKPGSTPSVASLIKGLVKTETFRFRRGEGK
jgi:hypothetical protein